MAKALAKAWGGGGGFTGLTRANIIEQCCMNSQPISGNTLHGTCCLNSQPISGNTLLGTLILPLALEKGEPLLLGNGGGDSSSVSSLSEEGGEEEGGAGVGNRLVMEVAEKCMLDGEEGMYVSGEMSAMPWLGWSSSISLSLRDCPSGALGCGSGGRKQKGVWSAARGVVMTVVVVVLVMEVAAVDLGEEGEGQVLSTVSLSGAG